MGCSLKETLWPPGSQVHEFSNGKLEISLDLGDVTHFGLALRPEPFRLSQDGDSRCWNFPRGKHSCGKGGHEFKGGLIT